MPTSPKIKSPQRSFSMRAVTGKTGPLPDITISLPTTASSSVFPQNDSTDELVPPYAPPAYAAASSKKAPIKLQPSLKLLFSLSSRRELLLYILPAAAISVFCGLLPPFTSLVLGKAFNIFASFVAVQAFTSSPTELDPARDKLLHDMLIIMIILLVTAVVTLIANVVGQTCWSWYGETVSHRLRHKFYVAISSKPLEWFDLGWDKDEGAGQDGTEEGGEAVGGMTGRFARESDDVRMAAGTVIGQLFQYLCTFLACLILALVTSAKLTLVILCGFPLVILLTVVTERYATIQLVRDRDITAMAASRIERIVNAIPTVKAFNAESYESGAVASMLRRVEKAYNTLAIIWGARLGVSIFVAMAMFVQGSWYGAELVRNGDLDAGQVSTVFWATLLSASHIQSVMPLLGQLERGKMAMAGLLGLTLEDEPATPRSHKSRWSTASSQRARKSPKLKSPTGRSWQKTHFSNFTGALDLHNVTFHYPARPHPAAPALKNVTMFIPARETTFIVGQSGSGKSTIGALLMGFYQCEYGRIEADEQNIELVDPIWLRSQIAMVSQGAAVVFEGTVHDNVAMGIVGCGNGRTAATVTRDEVIRACQAAMIDDFITGLPDGYDTLLSGDRGASLSGGQRQRLAIARAYIRDPPVLILDEATSALDVTSRTQVYASIKRWRVGKTTIVITHDLSPIVASDFIYVLRDGQVSEHGFRHQLEIKSNSTFSEKLRTQKPFDEKEADRRASAWITPGATPSLKKQRQSFFFGGGMLRLPPADVTSVPPVPTSVAPRNSLAPPLPRHSLVPPPDRASWRLSRPRTMRNGWSDSAFNTFLLASKPGALDESEKSDSLAVGDLPVVMRETSAATTRPLSRRPSESSVFSVTQLAGEAAVKHRQDAKEAHYAEELADVWAEDIPKPSPVARTMRFVQFVRAFWPLVPHKGKLFVGLICCVLVGAVTPLFSFFISRLLAALAPGSGTDLVQTSVIVLMLALADGLTQATKYVLLQQVAMAWVTGMREKAVARVVTQDKAWFDEPFNSVAVIVNIVVKDAEDARNIVGMIVGQVVSCLVMIGFGLIWALAVGWELTLAGMAVAPGAIGSMVLTARWIDHFEAKNKSSRELVAQKFHETAANVRAIRSMALEPVFRQKFEDSLEVNYRMQVKAAPLSGLSYAVTAATPYLGEAVLFYVGAVLMANGRYSFERVMQTISLVIFSVTFSAQILSYVPTVSKAVRAAIDLLRLLELPSFTEESFGNAKQPVNGELAFKNVTFAYPARADQPAVQNLSLEIHAGECVGLVGASGSGKSTVAALLQRLYEPNDGIVTLDGLPLRQIDVQHLRDHLAVVSQHPALFDASVSDNIAYGLPRDAVKDHVVAEAASQAHIADWIEQLPNGYATSLGDNASLLSGGQAQRLQIARALARKREVLILDECTSALDVENQRAVMQTIQSIKQGRTTLVITHKLDMMKMCDRLIVMEAGRVVETGTFEELSRKSGGASARLARVGEWNQ